MNLNQDYMLQKHGAKRAAEEIKNHFTENDLVKTNKLVHSMIKICSRDYDVEKELIEKELWD